MKSSSWFTAAMMEDLLTHLEPDQRHQFLRIDTQQFGQLGGAHEGQRHDPSFDARYEGARDAEPSGQVIL